MDRDVGLGQDRDTGHAAIRREMMQVDRQQRGTGGGDTLAQGLLDVVDVVQPGRILDVDQQMGAGEVLAVLADEEILPALVGQGVDVGDLGRCEVGVGKVH